ncbi:MAG: CoB--CoM heterodisulfide reductase iron-sulfur subunit A family protein [Bacteroidales bacterium]|nr:CoB--CoM heterodisulfide reductase iron-sulfur subunit A family protein [Bacteroidales bacterium]
MNKKLGIYICHCGGNISDYVDVEKVKKAIENEEGVAMAKTTMFACADSNQKEMVEDIKSNGLDGVIVASCSPKLHQITFRAVTERAGLNKYNYVHANIREQASWAHSDDKAGATEKAIHIVKAAIAKVRYAESLEPIKIKSKKAVAVFGAGVAGMKAAIELANMGSEVFLVEREFFVGGRTAQWDSVCTSNQSGGEIVSELYEKIKNHKNIILYTGAEAESYSGSIGDFHLKIRIKPSFVKSEFKKENIEKAISVCPVEVDDEFEFNLKKRKAIYQNKESEFPKRPVIDNINCTRCGECEKVCENIDFSQKEETVDLHVGSILMATGFDPYLPETGEFGFNAIDNVITLSQFQRLVSASNKELIYNGKKIKNIAYIYCVGSRQSEGENKFCSRYCCTTTIHSSIEAKKKFPGIFNFHFTRGIRTYGKQEALYHESSKMGDIYLQSYENDPPVVDIQNGKTIVKINDILTGTKEMMVEADLVVLVTGMTPRAENSIGSLFKLPKGRDKFFNEIHMKLRPVETVIDGITIAGTCQGPKNIAESVNSALSAATKSFSYVSKGELELEPIVAEVDKDTCTWCGICSEACPFDAIKKVDYNGKAVAVINNSNCKGCGMCLPVCPSDSIELIAFSNKEIESMIKLLAKD